MYLVYNRVLTDTRYTLMQIATAVADTLGDDMAVDAVQPMRTGWWIYL